MRASRATRSLALGRSVPQKTVSTRRLSIAKAHKSCGLPRKAVQLPGANPFVAQRRGDSVSPSSGRKIGVRTWPIKSDGSQPTPFPAHVRIPHQTKARVTSKGTASRMM